MNITVEKKWSPNEKLTPKENAFVRHAVEHPKDSFTEAAMQAYNAKNRAVAGNIARQLRDKPRIIAELEKYSTEAEMVLIEAMKAEKKIYKFNPETKSNEYMGSDPDHGIRIKAADSILDRVHGKATQKTENTSLAVQINVDLSGTA